jgi:radical SAM superfamily enzyme YgiQ (UPF0313 family)
MAVSGQDTDRPIVGGDAYTLTPQCVVTARADGLQLQAPIEAPPFYVELAELRLLAGVETRHPKAIDPFVAEIAEGSGVDFEDLKSFVLNLRYSSRLDRGQAFTHPAVADHPDFDEHAPRDLDTPGTVALRLPVVLRLRDGAFEILDHDGLRRAALTPEETHALKVLLRPVSGRAALAAAQSSGSPLDEAAFAALLGRLDGAGVLRATESVPTLTTGMAAVDRDVIVRTVFDRHAAAQDAAERAREERTGKRRVKVVPVAFDIGTPAGLGMIVAYAKAFENGRLDEVYDFRTDWVWSDDRLEQFTASPAIYLFSNYLWSHERCIAVSQRIKELSPSSITIHGGPDTPKHEGDARAYFAKYPHVDITVRGEGEVTTGATLAALTSVIGDATPDLAAALADVTGINYRVGSRVVRNPDRERVADLDILPSPFLSGLFDVFADIPELFITLETNRGCPYSCTFCDWGSATASRVRQFDMDRVLAELEWAAKSHVQSVSVADANFGMFKRDVEIAQHVADLKRAEQYPQAFGVSFAKNTVKHLQHIITVLADAGIMSQGVLSLQSMDQGTLDTIHRSNIKTERYDALADEMRKAQLPLMVELMMGLPGQTVDSFAEDLQQCINREVPARINHTTLLVNSPMNDPAYRSENRIEVSDGVGPGLQAVVISTSSFTPDDYRQMEQLRLSYMMYENFGALRHVARFVRQESGDREIDFYRTLRDRVQARPETWPALAALVFYGSSMMAAPYSWALVLDDLRRFIVSEFGLADDTALGSVLRTQQALLPAHGRAFPESVAVRHDVVEWHKAILTAKGLGHRTDWPDFVPRLAEFGPAEFTVDDPDHVTDTSLGLNRELNVVGVNWELDSPLSRARVAAVQLVDWVTEEVFPQRR